MRIAVVSWSSRRVGGIEDYLAALIPALQEAGHDVAFWHELDVPDDRERIPVPRGVSDTCAAETGLSVSLERLRDWKPDVIYVQGLTDIAVEARLLNIAPSVFFVHTYAGTCISGAKTFTRPRIVPCDRTFGWPCLAHYFPHGCGGRSPITMWRQFRHQSAQLGNLGRYGAILTHTEHMKTEMAKHGLEAAVVDYPVDAVGRADAQAGDAVWRLLFAGRMDPLKGGMFLLDAIAELKTHVKRPLHLALAGDGPDRARWEARARALRTGNPNLAVEFHGWIPQEGVKDLLRRTHLLVVPSLWPEPFGSIGPAAGLHGVPAAAFDVGGVSQWLADGVTGHLAPADPPTPAGLARAIAACLEDARHYAALREGAREMARRFTMERHLPQIVASFEGAIAAGIRT